MKKILLCSIALMGFLSIHAQEENDQITKVEIVKDSSNEYASAYGKHEFQFSMGIGLGKKWVNRNGFSFEAFAGFGRYFNKVDNGPEGHGRIGLAIGKRF
jgi:hypothetical protein